MKKYRWLFIMPVLAAALSCGRGSQVVDKPTTPAATPTPKAVALHGGGDPVDNARCHVCHINYSEEKLAIVHAEVGIGCEQCHGESDPHCGDEDNITPPDTIYALEKINPFCMMCHPQLSDLHKSIVAGTFDRKYCTECHGDHRLAYRTRHWDKTTRKLIESDGVRMMDDEPLLLE